MISRSHSTIGLLILVRPIVIIFPVLTSMSQHNLVAVPPLGLKQRPTSARTSRDTEHTRIHDRPSSGRLRVEAQGMCAGQDTHTPRTHTGTVRPQSSAGALPSYLTKRKEECVCCLVGASHAPCCCCVYVFCCNSACEKSLGLRLLLPWVLTAFLFASACKVL